MFFSFILNISCNFSFIYATWGHNRPSQSVWNNSTNKAFSFEILQQQSCSSIYYSFKFFLHHFVMLCWIMHIKITSSVYFLNGFGKKLRVITLKNDLTWTMFPLINKNTCSAFTWKVWNFYKITNANTPNFSHKL